MKLNLFFLLLSIPLFASGQNLTVTWSFKDGKCTTVIKSNDPADTKQYREEDVPSNSRVKLIIDVNQSVFSELSYVQSNNSTSKINSSQAYGTDKSQFFVEIVDKKLQRQGDIELSYPFVFTLKLKDTTTCKLTLGKHGSKNSEAKQKPRDTIPSATVNILKNVRYTDSRALFPSLEPAVLDKRNAIIAIDCSPDISSRTKIVRKNHQGVFKDAVNYLRVDDMAKIYLVNFNPYLYDVQIDDVFVDDTYASKLNTIDFPAPETDTTEEKETPGAAATQEQKRIENLTKLKNYEKAVAQLEHFIDWAKKSKHPNSHLLDENKRAIKAQLYPYGLTPEEDMEALFKDLPKTDQEDTTIKQIYTNASKFAQTLATLDLLSYTIEASLLPIQIKSYDRFEFKVLLKEKNTGRKVKEQTYSFKIRGGIKVDQTYGIVVHGIRSNEYALQTTSIRDTTFAVLPNGVVNNDSIVSIRDVPKRRIVADESPSKWSIGLSTLTHIYYRAGFVNIGPEIGFALDLGQKQSVRYLAGVGLLFGDGRHRVSVDFGGAYGSFETLSSTQKLGDLIDGTTDAQPKLVTKWRTSLYLGISYNIPLVKQTTQTPKTEK